nr:hypothetical protein CFP56_18134 [Quercus suber]
MKDESLAPHIGQNVANCALKIACSSRFGLRSSTLLLPKFSTVFHYIPRQSKKQDHFFYNHVLEQWNEVLCEVVDVFRSSFASISKEGVPLNWSEENGRRTWS